jgi:hypothetical protein
MRFFGRDTPNILVGVFLLMLLAVFAGPNTLPRFISSVVPFADEGVPCDWLRTADDRGNHQSLLARELSTSQNAPIALDVSVGPVPGELSGTLEVSITLVNQTIAPVPLVLTENRLILDPNTPESGLGVVFNSAVTVQNIQENVTAYPENRIHILEPRQRCLHRVNVVVGQIPNSSVLAATNTTIRAFYRNGTRGQIPRTSDIPGTDGYQPFTDQGLWVGVVESPIRNVAGSGL